jgi:hypothetical protein
MGIAEYYQARIRATRWLRASIAVCEDDGFREGINPSYGLNDSNFDPKPKCFSSLL